VQINKYAALWLLAGLAAVAAVFLIVFGETNGRQRAQAEYTPARLVVDPPAVPVDNSSVAQEPRRTNNFAPAAETAQPADLTNADPDRDSSTQPAAAPIAIASATSVVDFPASPLPPPSSAEEAALSDNLYPDLRFDPTPTPPSPDAAPELPPAANTPTVPAIVNGAGATFPYALYSRWFDDFHKLHPDVEFNYQPVGSGGGIQQLLRKAVDFGATDVPMSDQQLSAAKMPILHVPSVLSAVVPAYNVPGVRDMRFTAEILVGIFEGRIKLWNDEEIAAANPRVNLPNQPIIVVHRSDSSATTFIFTDYLSKVSDQWQHSIGAGTSVNWPVGLGGKGNEGVSDLLKQTPGAIAYIDFLSANQNQINYGSVRNSAGKFIKANLGSLTAAAASLNNIPTDFRTSISNASGREAYPISSFTWFLAPVRSRDAAEARDLVAFFRWMLGNGSQIAVKLGYAPLPRELASRVNDEISRIH
jgi:phosphate transport system substrate-binding protein